MFAIADLLTRDSYSLPNLRELTFRRAHHHSTIGGSLLDSASGSRVLYVAQYLPNENRDTRKSVTTRFQALADEETRPFKPYLDAFRLVAREAEACTVITPELWDQCALAWSRYCKHRFDGRWSAHRASINHFAEKLVNLLQEHRMENPRVLDFACGTGELSHEMRQHSSQLQITLLDSSPRMLRLAMETPTLQSAIPVIHRFTNDLTRTTLSPTPRQPIRSPPHNSI